MPIEVRDSSGPSDSSDTLDFISSDETLDRCGEIIQASGWKLSSYARNPVFQNAHQYGDIIFTLGRALITEVRGGRLYQRIHFASHVNPMARIAYGLYRGKFLSAVSVGFIPLRWENGGDKTPYSRKYLEQELLEVSAVAIPANPQALALGLKSGAVEKADLSDLADLIHKTLDTPRGAPVQSPIAARYARLMSLARQLHQLLKHS
jgi:HK97 family phage prohead protease